WLGLVLFRDKGLFVDRRTLAVLAVHKILTEKLKDRNTETLIAEFRNERSKVGIGIPIASGDPISAFPL
ncbi:MAG: hypothetical protein SH807_08480, partial [Blastochloris sp.]|nr:hypothetical protein [Blastochloris sp.]